MVTKYQAGFTLIEITIVTAISGLLLLIVFNGFSASRQQAQLTDSVDSLKETIQEQRTEALTSVNTSATGGTDQNQVIFGRAMVFTPNSSDIAVYSFEADNTDAPNAATAVTILGRPFGLTMKWKLVFSPPLVGGFRGIAFTRALTDQGTIPAGGLQARCLTTAQVASLAAGSAPNYPAFVPTAGSTCSFTFVGENNRQALITVDQITGNITRQYL